MSRLSLCIFEWDKGEIEALLEAKYAEHSRAGVPSPSVLLLSLSNATDLLGEPILREEMKDIWEEQSRAGMLLAFRILNVLPFTLSPVTLRREKSNCQSYIVPVDLHPWSRSTATWYSSFLECRHLLLTSRRTFSMVSLVGMVTEYKKLLTRLSQLPEHMTSGNKTFSALSKAVYGESVLPQFRALPQYTGEMFGVA